MEICFFHQLWLQEFGASMRAQVCFFRMKPGTKILMHSGGCNARLNLSLGLLGCSIAERAGGVGRVGIVGRSKLCKLKLDKFWFGVSSVDSCLEESSIYRGVIHVSTNLVGHPIVCAISCTYCSMILQWSKVKSFVIKGAPLKLLNPWQWRWNMSPLRLQRLIHPSRRRRATVAEWTAAGI